MAVSTVSPAITGPRANPLRTTIELVACLVILVSLFRTYLAGGYMIETGSMAPCLLGKHRPVVCPSCHFSFAVDGTGKPARAVCPNCGKMGISVEGLPENDGDHLLVHRGMYELRAPRRWEVIVFQNPNKPEQAYVKRLVGLPGESVQIKGGDVYVADEIQVKDYAAQRGLRIPVYDHDFRPPDDDPDWRPRWVIEQPEGHWRASGGKFRFTPSKAPSSDQLEWVRYRHWIRQGGSHSTSVPLANWPESLEHLQGGLAPLHYDADGEILVYRGALPLELRDRLLKGLGDSESRKAIEQLYDMSHIAPIFDDYGYNWGGDPRRRNEIRDLMLSIDVQLSEGQGQFVLAVTDGTEEFQCVFDRDARQVRLVESRTGRTLESVALNDSIYSKPVQVEVSLMDRQVLLALDGKLAFEPWRYPAPSERGPTPWIPVRFGAQGASVEISSLKLFRDVYYSDAFKRRAINRPDQLKSNEYFVLGDNSPVSQDSRSWTETTVLTKELFLGKPLVVHLPSRKKRIQIGGWQTEIRIPEFSRMRYIH
jgi:signal peptidase I